MRILILFLVAACLFVSCKKHTVAPPVAPNATADIYLSGYDFYPNGIYAVATYWKNGVAVHLTDGSTWSEARSIVVSGNDVYVAGRYGDSAVYWKNVVPTVLSGIRPNQYDANSIAVSGSDVYVAGTETGVFNQFPLPNYINSVALYWKNGVPVYLSSDTIGSASLSIAVSGNDVYTAGYSWNPHGLDDNNVPMQEWEHYEEATYWKNGTAVFLTDGATQQARCSAIKVSGSDVYVAGNILYDVNNLSSLQHARYWENGTPVTLPGDLALGIGYTNANDIAVSGSDVYVLGMSDTSNVYWKNSVPVPINFRIGAFAALLKAIDVLSNDVYIGGLQADPANLNMAAECWKNGNLLMTVDSTSLPDVLSMYLVNK